MNPNPKRPLMILGNGPTQRKGVRIVMEQNIPEVWGCNNLLFPEVTMLFQMHGDHFVKTRFLNWYRMHPPKVPLVMQHVWSELPTSIPFPMDQYRNAFPWGRVILHDPDSMADQIENVGGRGLSIYHSCTMSYMLALAFMSQRYNPIYLFGVDFYHELRHESTFEKPCVEAHIGFGLGAWPDVRVIMPASSRLFTTTDNARQVYGVEWNPPLTSDEMVGLSQQNIKRGSKETKK